MESRKRNIKSCRKITNHNHPRGDYRNRVLEHILIVESVLGKYLPHGAVVHHVNEDRTDNRKENLVLCQDENYHRLLHQRTRAFNACGHADWLLCSRCRTYDSKPNFNIYYYPELNRTRHYHKKTCQPQRRSSGGPDVSG